MAGFQVIIYGRFWVFTEATNRINAAHGSILRIVFIIQPPSSYLIDIYYCFTQLQFVVSVGGEFVVTAVHCG